jgi:hypothetical protein
LLIGAGGINALTGEKLGTVLAQDNYLVAPPQPWLDGWKDKDGTVYQFVATPYQKGKGISVAEQLIGEESKTGAIGIAVYNVKADAKLKSHHMPGQVWGDSGFGELTNTSYTSCSQTMDWNASCASPKKRALASNAVRSSRPVMEMGIGKGGRIIQKIYPDPHGLEVWQEKPTSVFAVYLVDAKTAEEITGEKVTKPTAQEEYNGNWFGLQDQELGDVAGSGKFSGLKSAAFPGDTANVAEEKEEVAAEAAPAE